MRKAILTVLAFCVFVACSLHDEMSFKIGKDGLLTMSSKGVEEIAASPVGLACKDGVLYAPLSLKKKGNSMTLKYECGEVELIQTVRSDGSIRIEVSKIDDGIDTYFFGPYECPGTADVGEILGAAWHTDGSLICIQSLNPKTVGMSYYLPSENRSGFHSPGYFAAFKDGDKGYLCCRADNFTRPRVVPSVPCGLKNVVAEAIPAPEGAIVGAAVIITRADNAEEMLEKISVIELEEGLPHPMLDGQWAKTAPRTSEIYFDFADGDIDAQIRTVQKAGARWIYFSDPFKSWGHFDLNPAKYPGGEAQFKAAVDNAIKQGINVGTHTLSNFIHQYDPYVTPVPHKDLLAFDLTELRGNIGDNDTEISISEVLNYPVRQNLSLIRIEDELIRYGQFDEKSLCFKDCIRGACGTKASAHQTGSIVTHLADHGYHTLFPNHSLQTEMAGRIGEFMAKYGLRRLSFDGLEGCRETGHGEYGPNSFVQTVFDKTDGNIMCDASNPSHYRWHAMSYFNWGEPWYDSDRRGGGYNYRARNQDYFHLNLLPGMLGWYKVCESERHFEPTLPETLEFIMSRTVGFQAGCLLSYTLKESEKADRYLALVKDWQDFRFGVQVPDDVRKMMRDQDTDWHLEKTTDKWVLSHISITDYDLRYGDRKKNILQMESGTTAYQPWGNYGSSHFTMSLLDRSSADKVIPDITEPAHLRVRVGTPEEQGQLNGFTICGGWYGGDILSFDVTANAGDYLEYCGGKTLLRYDKDYNLIEKVEGAGRELIVSGSNLTGLSLKYNLSNDDLSMTLKYIRTIQKFEYPITKN